MVIKAQKRKGIEMKIVREPYKLIAIRELAEFSKDDFMTILLSAGMTTCYYCDGVAIMLERYVSNDDQLEVKDQSLILSKVHYCFMDYTPVIKTDDNIQIPLIKMETSMYKAIAENVKA